VAYYGHEQDAFSATRSGRSRKIEHLELLIANLRRIQFGRSSEKVERQIEQLELKLEGLEADRAELAPELPAEPAVLDRSPASRKQRSLPDHLPREVHNFAAYPENHRLQIPSGAHWREVRRAAKNVGRHFRLPCARLRPPPVLARTNEPPTGITSNKATSRLPSVLNSVSTSVSEVRMLSRHFSLQRFNIVDGCMIREFANCYISADPAVFQDVVELMLCTT
jgi:hypothetical protein